LPIYLKQFTKFANAGDVASSYILSRLLSDDVETVGQAALDHANLIAIGSILHWADAHSVIWGSGLISAEIKLQTPPARLVAVRGHLTRRRLQAMGIAAPDLVGDPGILMSDFYSPPRRAPTAVGIIPHYVDAAHPFVTQAQDQGAQLIDPLWPLEKYLAELANCEVIISSSLHGVIFAHSYGIPAAWVSLSDRVIGKGFKFRDYYSSIGIDPNDIPMLTGADSVGRVVDAAGLPRTAIDRAALRTGLMEVAAELKDATLW
jgi:pyruvyltransferase